MWLSAPVTPSCLHRAGWNMDSHEHHGDEIFMAGPRTWYQRGCVPEQWAPVSAAMHYLKTLIQRRLQGTPFVTPSGTPSVSELRRSRRSRDRGGQVDRGEVDRCEGGGGAGQSCVGGRVKVRTSTFSSVDTVNLDFLPANTVHRLHMSLRMLTRQAATVYISHFLPLHISLRG